MVRWVVGSILHGVDPLSYFSFQPVLHDCVLSVTASLSVMICMSVRDSLLCTVCRCVVRDCESIRDDLYVCP